MEDSKIDVSDPDERLETFVEGLDFYFDEGMMVLTRRYLHNRGYCCENGCRNCPYDTYKARGSK